MQPNSLRTCGVFVQLNDVAGRWWYIHGNAMSDRSGCVDDVYERCCMVACLMCVVGREPRGRFVARVSVAVRQV